jgi:hypothetical protein
VSYRITFACGHTEIIPHLTNHQPPFQSKDICSECKENAFYMVLNLWDRPREEHGTPKEAAMTLAWFLRSRHGCQVSGVLATMREQAIEIEQEHAQLAKAYREFVQDVEAWILPAEHGREE